MNILDSILPETLLVPNKSFYLAIPGSFVAKQKPAKTYTVMSDAPTTYAIIIEFRYGLQDDNPFYELSQRLHERWEAKDAIGKFDGHEIAMDNFDARLYFYTPQPQQTLAMADPILKAFPFLRGAKIHIRHGESADSFTETEIIKPDGEREALSRLDEHKISAIPDWGSRERPYMKPEEGEEWKFEMKNKRAEKLYNKWKEIDFIITAIWDKWDLSRSANTGGTVDANDDESPDMDDEDDFSLPPEMISWQRDEMFRNSLIIPAKISGAEAGDMYILRMENAAIIRKAANDIYVDTNMLSVNNVADDHDIELLRSEIEQFREYFIEWVSGFEKDEFEDEWGLF